MRYRTFYERYLLKIKKATGSVSFQSLTNLIFRFLGRASIPYHCSSFLGNKKGDRVFYHLKKTEIAKAFEKGDLIHIFGYFKKREKEGKTYKNFVVKSYNKIEKKKENEEE